MEFLNIFIFLFGLVVGSFLNAVIYRLQSGDSAMRGRSYCPRCKHALAWHELIPLASFALLRGTCRYCKKRISWQYPLVEGGTALIFLLIFSTFEPVEALPLFVVASLLIVLFVYDLRHYILPDKIVFPAIGLATGWILLAEPDRMVSSLAAGVVAASFFFAIYALSKGRAMGFGDVKLALFIGLFLGWPNIAVALFIAFMVGAVVGIALIALKKKEMKSQVPFGPFLVAGTFAALFRGEEFVAWYLNFLLV